MKLRVNLFFIHHFLRRLLTHIIPLAGHGIGRTPDRFFTTKNITGFWNEFGYVKYLIVPFWYATGACQARLVSPCVFEQWLDQTHLICRRLGISIAFDNIIRRQHKR